MSEYDEAQERQLQKTSERKKRGYKFGGPAGRMIVTEKPRDFKGTVGKLIRFLGRFKFAVAAAFLFAIGNTAFGIVGPKVLSEATTELFEGLVAKVQGTGAIDFEAIWRILMITLVIYLFSMACQFVQGWILTYVSQKTCYEFRREISEKIDRIEDLTRRIFTLVEQKPAMRPQINKFMNYYLPTTLKLLDSYALLEAQGIEGDNITASKQEIERTMDLLVAGFEKQLDLLFRSQAMDISSDVAVLEGMMAQDGLGENKYVMQTGGGRK